MCCLRFGLFQSFFKELGIFEPGALISVFKIRIESIKGSMFRAEQGSSVVFIWADWRVIVAGDRYTAAMCKPIHCEKLAKWFFEKTFDCKDSLNGGLSLWIKIKNWEWHIYKTISNYVLISVRYREFHIESIYVLDMDYARIG